MQLVFFIFFSVFNLVACSGMMQLLMHLHQTGIWCHMRDGATRKRYVHRTFLNQKVSCSTCNTVKHAIVCSNPQVLAVCLSVRTVYLLSTLAVLCL